MAGRESGRGRGRPRTHEDGTMHQIAIRLPEPLLAAIDEMLADRLDRLDRSTLIRTLLAEAIEARRKATRK